MGEGMEQGPARRRAKELGGIAVSARKGSAGRWITGGWGGTNNVWIVVSVSGQTVLDDGGKSDNDLRRSRA